MLAPRRCPAHQCTARHIPSSSSLSTGNHVLFAFNHSPAGAEQALAAGRLGLTTHQHLPPQPLCFRELPIPCPVTGASSSGGGLELHPAAWTYTQCYHPEYGIVHWLLSCSDIPACTLLGVPAGTHKPPCGLTHTHTHF